jgi:hypothetical protein
MRRAAGVLALTVLAATPAAAQSSQFGARGFGVPVRPLSVRALGAGGGFGLFDPESGLNPAAVGQVLFVSAGFMTTQNWRNSESPVGSSSAKDNRFPGFSVTGPIGRSTFSFALSATGFTDRNFVLGSVDTLVLRDVPVEVYDTLISLGGISDLRAALAWRQSRAIQWGIGLHVLTGSNRIRSRRSFADTAYAPVSEGTIISYLGFGASAGVSARLGSRLTLAGTLRVDERMRAERDTNRSGTTRLPVTVGVGARMLVTDRLMLAGNALFRNWSIASDDLVQQGGVGSENTREIGAGIEFLTRSRRPFSWPIRLGVHHATLPFPLVTGEQPRELGVSIGTSVRFVADRAGFDLALMRLWRSSGGGFTEQATQLSAGISVRP